MENTFTQKAIRLIYVDETGKYVLHPEGASFISQIQGPIAVVSVAGLYRTGKSYLLNKMLLNRSNGFGVGPTVNPCTKGLWCWGTPIKGTTIDGQKINVVIIDTEGIGALDEDQTHDTRIFTLAILAASSFIYNSVGSIDENALQNLSLVVNLTKSIQISTHEEDEEDDPEELSTYFPAFYWVVRDFALQLVNSEGEEISSKQYLERALAPQKGFSDDVEEKNRIRRLLSTFFTERQCITLYRPLVDQTKLQHLDKLSDEDLRPEFVDQVFNLRKRILGRLKPKMIKGKKLDGSMYLCLLNSYVAAINKGAVPNIENAWSYMCKEKCAKVFEESERFFQEEVSKKLKMPCSEQELMSYCEELKELACDNFESDSIGEETRKNLKELRNKLALKIKKMQMENEREAEIGLRTFFMKSYTSNVGKRLTANEFNSFEEFVNYLSNFYQDILEKAPPLPRKQLTFLQIIKKCIPSAADWFLKKIQGEHEKLKKLSEEKETMNEKRIQKLEQDFEEEMRKNNQKISKLDRQYTSLLHEYEELKEHTEKKTQEMVAEREDLEKTLKLKLEDYSKKEIELQSQLNNLQEDIVNLKSEKSNIKGEWQKEKAVSKFKIDQLSIEVEGLKKKEMNLEVTLRNVEHEKGSLEKELNEKYDNLLWKKQNEIKNIKESLSDYEDKNGKLQTEITKLMNQILHKEVQFKEEAEKNNQEIQRLNTSYKNEKQRMKESLTQDLQSKSAELSDYKEKMASMEKQFRLIQDELKQKEAKFVTEIAVSKQTIELMEMESEEKRKEYSQQKLFFEEQIRKMEEEQEENGKENENMNAYMEEYESKISEMKVEYESKVKKMETDYDSLEKKLNGKQLELKLIKTNFLKTETEYQNRIQEYEEKMKDRLNEKEDEYEKIVKDFKSKEKNYIEKIENLTEQMEEIKEEGEREQRQMYEQSEEKMLQVKNLYAMEKQRMENRLANEKQKYEKKVDLMEEQFQKRVREETEQLEEEVEQLRMDNINLEANFSETVSSLEHQKQMKIKNLENQERINEELKLKVQHLETENRKSAEKIKQENLTQKNTLYKRIEDLQNSLRTVEKEAAKACSQRDQSEKIVQMKERNLSELNEELSQFRTKYEKLKEESKNQIHELKSKIQQYKLESQKRIAVLEEQKKHGDERLEEYEKNSESLQQITEEKMKKIRQQLMGEAKVVEKKNQEIIEGLENKLEAAKRMHKENESSLQKTVNNLEKEILIMNQKMGNYKQKLSNAESKQISESENLNEQIISLKAHFKKEKAILNQTVQKEKKERETVEGEKTKVSAQYQQDKMLWENKYKFLQETHKKYKQEYEQNRSKLETAIENDRKKRTNEKMAGDNSHAEQMRKLQKSHQTKIQQIYETNNKKERELQNSIRNLQFENRELLEKLALENQNSKNNQNISERKIKDYETNQKRLASELEKVKNSKEADQHELVTNYEKDKQILRQKLNEKEEKCKAVEKQKQLMFYENSKQKAKWDAEKEQLCLKITDLNEKLEKSQKESDKVKKQMERLKVEKKCIKNSSIGSGNRLGNVSHISNLSTLDHRTKSSFEDSILKQNNTSQASDTSFFFFKND